MFDTEVNSGFTSGGDINISSCFTEISLLHKSGNGYSEVYKAKRYGQWHVLKCLTKEAAKEIQYQTLLEKEFRIAYPLSHPNIVRTLGIEEVNDLGICIIQEFIDGEPISSISRKQAAELCDAIGYIHQCGVIHRDIKPENVLVRKDNGQIVLIDFGLADKTDFSVLKGGAGTTGYAAPEQWTGALSPAIDIYGIGGVLAMNNHFKRIANKCRRENPLRRYTSAQEVKKALLRKFPWGWLIGILFLFVLSIGAYVVYSTYTTDVQRAHENAMGQKTQMEQLQHENSLLNDKIIQIQKERDKQVHSLQQQLEREHNTNVRLLHETNSFLSSPNSYQTAEDQRY